MKSRVTSKRFGSTNENRASHFASPIGREMICMYANSVWVNCITWHSVMTKLCWICGWGSFVTGPCQGLWPQAGSSHWWQVEVFTEVIVGWCHFLSLKMVLQYVYLHFYRARNENSGHCFHVSCLQSKIYIAWFSIQ